MGGEKGYAVLFLSRTRAFQSTAGCRSLILLGWWDAATAI